MASKKRMHIFDDKSDEILNNFSQMTHINKSKILRLILKYFDKHKNELNKILRQNYGN
ncbi:MAG: hypothetical protein ACFFCV_05970 [Promethearchaeota archaeon]